MMHIQTFEIKYSEQLWKLHTKIAQEEGFLKPFEEEKFYSFVLENPHFDPNLLLLAIEDHQVLGFALGFIRKEDRQDESKPGYVSLLLVDPKHRRQGIGTALLDALQESFKQRKRTSMRCVFFSPVNWPWIIPKTKTHDHPGAPAIRVNSPEYFFFLHNKFHVEGIVDAFHLPLSEYELTQDVSDILEHNKKEDIIIELYDPNKHFGLEEFYVAIDDRPFENAIKSNLEKDQPKPFLVISKSGKVVGWTGALYTEESGRAHFDGIANSPEVRGRGMGKALFCVLAKTSKDNGSEFMTFFTGLDNMARFIYLYAGFKIIQTFAIVRKKI